MTIDGDDVFIHRDYMVDGKTLAKLFRLFVRVDIGALPASFLLGFGNLACIAITSFGKMSKKMLLKVIGGGTVGTASFIGISTGDGIFMGSGGGADATASLLFLSTVPFFFLISRNLLGRADKSLGEKRYVMIDFQHDLFTRWRDKIRLRVGVPMKAETFL